MQTRLRRLVRRYPRLREPAREIYRSGQYLAARALGRLRQDPLRPLWVDPRAIENTIAVDDPALTGSSVGHLGTVDGGDWDLNGVPLRAHGGVFPILKGRVVDGRAWLDIPQYRSNLALIEQGQIVDSAATPAEYAARWSAIEALYERIAREGYKSQAQLGSPNPLDEVRIQIGRHGELLFEEGLHRLAIAQLLALPRIPVLVTRRHAQWAGLREAVLKIVGRRGFFHQPFGHPDLDCLNEWYGSELALSAVYGQERWGYLLAAISDPQFPIPNPQSAIPNPKSQIPNPRPAVLDIGAYFGYFCHRFAGLGFACTAVESDPLNAGVLRRWREIEGCQFVLRELSIFDLPQTQFDIVLALNIFHHFVRTPQGYAQLQSFLQRLNCRVMFFEPHDNAGVEAAYHLSDEAFIDFVLANSGLSKARLLGQAREGRTVYLLT